MLIITKFAFIIFYSFTFIKNNLNAIMFCLIIAIIFTYAGVFSLSTFDIQSIGSGIGFYSELFLYNDTVLLSLNFTIFSRVYKGVKKGLMTPTLPDNILKFQLNPLIRIFRVLGGLSILLLLGKSKITYPVPLFLLYILLLFGILFFIYHLVISYFRIKHVIALLKSKELEIRNSPLDRLATLAARAILCAKGVCDTAAPVAVSLSLMLGVDEVVKAGGREAIFAPFLANILLFIFYLY